MRPTVRKRGAAGLVAMSLSAVAILFGSSAATSAVASTAPDCGGESATLPNGTPMTCTFDDEFSAATGDATALDTSKWFVQTTAYSGFTTGPAGYRVCYVNTPQAVNVANGVLNLSVYKMANAMNCATFSTKYAGGTAITATHFSQTYGKFEVRAKLPATAVRGLHEALWLWPNNAHYYGTWPASGEVDFAEFYSSFPYSNVPYLHYNFTSSTTNTATNTNVVTNRNCPLNYGQFNTYDLQWQPGTMTVEVNGVTCLVDNYVPDGKLTAPAPFDQPFFLALTQGFGQGGDAPYSGTPLPATTQVDYVRVWK